MKPSLRLVLRLISCCLFSAAVGCSPSQTGTGAPGTGTGGSPSAGTGGHQAGGTGGNQTGTGGSNTGTGGGSSGTGGESTAGTGGAGTGGAVGTGGQTSGTGGAPDAGTSAGTGGAGTGFTPYVCPTGMGSPTSFPAGSTATRVAGVPPSDSFNNNGNNFENIEGPVWINNALYVSEFGSTQTPPPSRILKIDESDTVTIAFPSITNTGSNGLAVDQDGNIIAANHNVGGITKINIATGVETTIIDMFGGKRFNAPNDLTIRSDGTIYFSDPAGYQGNLVQPNQGVYMLPPGATTAVELISTLNQPNGVALSLDGKTLYVDDNGDGVMTYAVNTDGTIVTPGTALDTTDLAHKSGDGVAIDCAGDFYVVIGNQSIYVVNPAGNTIGNLGSFPNSGGQITNIAFGGADHKTLYVTSQGTGAQRGVFKLPLSVQGMPY